MNKKGNLTESLIQLIDFFTLANMTFWVNKINPILAKIGSSHSQKKAVKSLLKFFGGMGSLNDIYICDQNKNIPLGFTEKEANQKLKELLDRVFRDACLLNATTQQVADWLEAEESSELPLRIARTFK